MIKHCGPSNSTGAVMAVGVAPKYDGSAPSTCPNATSKTREKGIGAAIEKDVA